MGLCEAVDRGGPVEPCGGRDPNASNLDPTATFGGALVTVGTSIDDLEVS